MSEDHTLVMTRILDAPREIVFAAWVDQDQAARWWGPKGFTSVACTMDVRVGGTWRRVMRAPDGVEHRARGIYREIVPPERLVFTYAWERHSGHGGHQTLVTLNFVDLGGRTELTLRHEGFETAASRDDHHGGWSGCLERLAAFLAQRSR
jgi:uncharacterized protein YndB with AHSA1/START domain